METTVEKLKAENAALRAKLQTMEDQFKTLNSINYYQAFIDQRTRADGLELQYGRVRGELGKLQGLYDRDWANWGMTVGRLKGQLTAAQAENAALLDKLQTMEGRQPATVSDQSAVLRL